MYEKLFGSLGICHWHGEGGIPPSAPCENNQELSKEKVEFSILCVAPINFVMNECNDEIGKFAISGLNHPQMSSM